MIPSKSKAILISSCQGDTRSMMLNWAGLGLALVFLAIAAHIGG